MEEPLRRPRDRWKNIKIVFKCDVRPWTRWLKIGNTLGCYETFGFIKVKEFLDRIMTVSFSRRTLLVEVNLLLVLYVSNALKQNVLFQELRIALKLKQEEMSEITIRKELAEKKLGNVNKDYELTIEKLQVSYFSFALFISIFTHTSYKYIFYRSRKKRHWYGKYKTPATCSCIQTTRNINACKKQRYNTWHVIII
jgi:hypothetical protein